MGNSKSKLKKTNKLRNPDPIPSFIRDRFTSYDDLQRALRTAGLEASQLIVGIDFTKSNTWNGGLPYYQNECLHSVVPYPNPYQQVLNIIGQTLEPFDDDHLIPAYGFGDSATTDKLVFPFMLTNTNGYPSEAPCVKLSGVLQAYDRILQDIAHGRILMSGPTSFGPIIRKAIEIVRATKAYHILLIITDGAVDRIDDTVNAIVDASNYPLSIICIGVGKGPWETMNKFDDNIPQRNFDNFQFVNFHDVMRQSENQELEFAKHAMMEIPDQYTYIKRHILSK
jgi:E3 ubiquitin-protein ligase RGLG